MKVISTIQELDSTINELRESVISKGFNYFKFYLVGEQTIRDAAAKYNLTTSYYNGLNGLFLQADNNVKGLSLSGSEELEFVYVASIEGPTNGDFLAIDSLFQVVKYKDYLLMKSIKLVLLL